MTREIRWRTAGILFYLVFIFNLIVTRTGQDTAHTLILSTTPTNSFQVLLTLLVAGIGVFTSDAIGYAINTVVFFWWDILRGGFQVGKGGYSAEYERSGNYAIRIRDVIIEEYRREPKDLNNDALTALHERFEKKWGGYSPDVFLSYLWQYAPKYIDGWDTGRYTAFFTNMSSATGILFGLLLSSIIILTQNIGWTSINYAIVVIAAICMVMFYANGRYAREEAWQIVDLWVAGLVNPRLRMALRKLRVEFGIDRETGE